VDSLILLDTRRRVKRIARIVTSHTGVTGIVHPHTGVTGIVHRDPRPVEPRMGRRRTFPGRGSVLSPEAERWL